MLGDERLRIGDVAQLAGVSTRTVRHYHAIGLLPEPDRRANGYREYSVVDASRLLRVRHLVGVGLSLEKIAGLLDPSHSSIATELDHLETVLREQIAALSKQVESVVALRGSVLPEAPAKYDSRDDVVRRALEDGTIRRFEADVSLLLAAADPAMHTRLGATMDALSADPELSRRLATVTADLFTVGPTTSEDARDRIASEISAVVSDAGLPNDFGRANEDLISQYRAAAFTTSQLDVLARLTT